MSFPRRLLPGQTHSVTRRCVERRFLLRPSEFVNDVVRYALARAKQRYPEVSLHAYVAEANHTHAMTSRAVPSVARPGLREETRPSSAATGRASGNQSFE